MVAMSASDTCDVIDPTYDAASLRKYEGLTVRLPVFCKQSSVLTKSRSKNSGRSKTCTNTQLPEYSSSNNEQMTDSAVCDDIRERHAELCYSNCHRVGSALSCLIRQRLLSPFAPPQASFSPSSVSRRPTHLLTIAILLLTLHSVLTTTLASSIAKVPLTRTDATALDGFRKFKGLGPNVKRDGKGPSVVSPRSNFISKYFRLDFQTLKVIKRWGSHNDLLLVGGRDYIYMINATLGDGPIRYLERLKWESSVESRRACRQMGKQKHECNNFLRVIELLEDDRLYVCGTNSYEPTCRYYSRENFPFLSQDSRSNSNYDDEVVCRGQCECPYNPLTSSTNLYTNTSSGFQLFTAVINDFMGKKPVLMRKSDSYVYSVEKWFNDPTFIKMVDSDDGKVYLFFRETATTVETGSSLQMTYARVAQVCKNDTGGTTVLRFQWSTFLKARLKCSLPGSDRGADFNFDNLTSVSEVTRVVGSDGRAKDVIFATFTTPWDWNAVAMSAVCVYSMDDIRSLFESGSFLGKQELHSRTDDTSDYLDRATGIKTLIKAIPVPQREVPVPRPGRCSSPTSATNDKTLYFAKDHFLMYDPVMPLDGQPVYIGETDLRATQITVDADTSDESARMVYVGTEDGRILRLRPRLRFNTGPKALLLEEMRVANEKKCTSGRLQCGVLALHVSRPASDSSDPAGANLNLWPSIFVAFTDRLTQVPLSGCKQYVNYECCNVDPDCGWLDEKCIPRTAQNSRQLPAISTMADLPTNCQAQAEPKPCSLTDIDPAIRDALCEEHCAQSASPTRGCMLPKSTMKQRINGLIPRARSAVRRQDKEVNDDPDLVTLCHDVNARSKKPTRGTPEAEITDLFTERVLPLVSDEFRATFQTLQMEQRLALMTQLQEALTTTTKLVLRNHKEEYCLPSPSVNGLTHTYPILLREIETWHNIALKKMTHRGLQLACWGERNAPPCPTRISFSSSFPPTLWEPLTHLAQEFEAVCDPVPTAAPSAHSKGCDSVPGLLDCKDERNSNNPLCQTMQCRFNKFAVDVKAFFRHVNDSRKFLAADKVLEPLWKPVNVSVSPDESIKGHLELLINDDTENPQHSQHFEMQFSPVTEKVKITFYYVPVRECSWNERSCAHGTQECNPRLENGLDVWFEAVMAGLKPKTKKCLQQMRKSKRRNRPSATDRQQGRKRRSVSRITDNQIHQIIPTRCRFVTKSSKIPSGLWDELVLRAQNRGGVYSDIHERVEFFSQDDIKLFFDNQCSNEQRDERHENLARNFTKKRKRVQVEIFASREMPFVIEKHSANRVRLQYFTHMVR